MEKRIFPNSRSILKVTILFLLYFIMIPIILFSISNATDLFADVILSMIILLLLLISLLILVFCWGTYLEFIGDGRFLVARYRIPTLGEEVFDLDAYETIYFSRGLGGYDSEDQINHPFLLMIRNDLLEDDMIKDPPISLVRYVRSNSDAVFNEVDLGTMESLKEYYRAKKQSNDV